MEFRFSKHAREEMVHRDIPLDVVEAVLRHPEQTLIHEDGLLVFQARIAFTLGKWHLVRVFVNPERDPAVVVTVYRTSRIEKYWRLS